MHEARNRFLADSYFSLGPIAYPEGRESYDTQLYIVKSQF